jgi:hypothetical protein
MIYYKKFSLEYLKEQLYLEINRRSKYKMNFCDGGVAPKIKSK